jgi:hypothetical protein
MKSSETKRLTYLQRAETKRLTYLQRAKGEPGMSCRSFTDNSARAAAMMDNLSRPRSTDIDKRFLEHMTTTIAYGNFQRN